MDMKRVQSALSNISGIPDITKARCAEPCAALDAASAMMKFDSVVMTGSAAMTPPAQSAAIIAASCFGFIVVPGCVNECEAVGWKSAAGVVDEAHCKHSA